MSDSSIQPFWGPSWQAVHPGFVRAAWFLLLAFALHEAEEWNLLAWYQAHFPDAPAMSATNVRVTLFAVIPISWLWVYTALRAASPRRAAFIILPLAAALFLNALQHIYYTARWLEYGPGIVTALTLLVPASSLLAWRAWQDGLVPGSFIAAAAILVVLTFGVWAVNPDANTTRKMLAADHMGAVLVRVTR